MAFNWNKFPWTNLHDLNLDWIIQKVRELEIKVLDAAQVAVKYTDSKISDLLTGDGDLTINKSGDVRITANSVQVTGGATFIDNGEPITLYDPDSKTGMTAVYKSSLLGLRNNQDLNRGTAVFNVRTPEEGEYSEEFYPYSNFAASVGYVNNKFDAINTDFEAFLTGTGDITINKTGSVSISGDIVEISGRDIRTEGVTISDSGDQLTMRDPASNTNMTANYRSGTLELRNNQDLNGGVSLKGIITPPDEDGMDLVHANYAANVGYVKNAISNSGFLTLETLPIYGGETV